MDDELDFERWESAVGKIVMALSRVEGELFLKYQTRYSRRKYFNDDLKKRLERIRCLYIDECGQNSDAELLFEAISSAIEYRNLVAHNPVYADMSGDFLKFRISTLKQDPLAIDLIELETKAMDICSLCTEFSVLLRSWVKN